MLQEREELEGKLKKAKRAVQDNPFNMVPAEKDLLSQQTYIMERYLNILNQRIDFAKNKKVV